MSSISQQFSVEFTNEMAIMPFLTYVEIAGKHLGSGRLSWKLHTQGRGRRGQRQIRGESERAIVEEKGSEEIMSRATFPESSRIFWSLLE